MTTTADAHSELSAAALEPILSQRFALSWKHVVVCLGFALLFMYLNYLPLFHTDIWGHVSYGQWILEHGSLPQEDPFMPLAEGMPVIHTAWLSQVIFASADNWGGPHFLSNLFAVVVFATFLIQARIFYLISGRKSLAFIGFLMVLFIGWTRHATIRPEIFGGLSFALLLWMIVRLPPWRSRAACLSQQAAASSDRQMLWFYFGVGLLFAFWANVHGSFMVGIGVLGCHALGRFIEVAWRTKSLAALMSDRWLRRWVIITEIAFAATLINPHGVELIIAAMQFGVHENLRDVMEWRPLRLIDLEGMQWAASILAIIVVLRLSRLRIRVVEAIMLFVFAAAVAPSIRMIGWYAPVFALVLAPHLSEICNRLLSRKKEAGGDESRKSNSPAPSSMQFVGTLICLLIVWTAFSLSPISSTVLGGKKRSDRQLYNIQTPLGVSEFLRENPPEKMVWSPQWWGDWITRSGPEETHVFATTSIHLTPRQVWKDYMRIASGENGWEGLLDRYDIGTLVIHKDQQKKLTRLARRSSRWEIAYEDELALVLRRDR